MSTERPEAERLAEIDKRLNRIGCPGASGWWSAADVCFLRQQINRLQQECDAALRDKIEHEIAATLLRGERDAATREAEALRTQFMEINEPVIEAANRVCERQNTTALCDLARALATRCATIRALPDADP